LIKYISFTKLTKYQEERPYCTPKSKEDVTSRMYDIVIRLQTTDNCVNRTYKSQNTLIFALLVEINITHERNTIHIRLKAEKPFSLQWLNQTRRSFDFFALLSTQSAPSLCTNKK
jgi:hypothetical protein